MTTFLSTASLSPSDRAARWHEAVSHTFIPLDLQLLESAPSPGMIEINTLGPIQISHVVAGPQTVTRTKRLIARDCQDSVIVSLQHRGIALKEQDGRESFVKPGSFSFSDASRPFRKKLDGGFSFTSFHFAREELQKRDVHLKSTTAIAFTSRTGSSALVATYLARMARHAATFDASVGRRIAATALDLLVILMDEHSGCPSSGTRHAAAASLERVKDHIRRNLSDHDLSPSKIAEANSISVRYLHKLFRLEGVALGEWIRMQRLERCRRDLLSPAADKLGVAGVAWRWGFASPSHFSRSFRSAYGMPPGEWRAHGQQRARHGD
ncbi:helix-turn-helix domain-containing protein [Streptomyces sp. NPDC003483]